MGWARIRSNEDIYIYIKRQRHRQKNDNWTRETEKKERRDTQAKGMNIRINI